MNGQLADDIRYDGSLTIEGLIGTLTSSINIDTMLSVGSVNPTYYDGEYEITPQPEAQTLNTKDKLMADDMTIKKIPYYETSNEYGYTAYIGSEVEIDGN